MTYDITKDKELLKNKGYTLVDYTEKIKTFKDIKEICDKVNTTNNGKYKYQNLIVIMDIEKICKRIVGFRKFILKLRDNTSVMEVMHTKNTTYFDKNSTLSEVAWMEFINREDTQTCEVCCETMDTMKMMPCHTCNYKCCKKCFYKRMEITFDGFSKPDVHCFGCRQDLLIINFDKKPK